MICFQFSIFELPETTICLRIELPPELWFAFNSVYLNYQKQLRETGLIAFMCCDLLSIQYIWTTRNNEDSNRTYRTFVVICFQFSIFELPETTGDESSPESPALWFAFNSVYLNYQKQHSFSDFFLIFSCDLLSIQYIWTTRNNLVRRWRCAGWVVICFQFSIFELPETTSFMSFCF